MSTALVSAFYDIDDVIQQSKQRPSSLDLRFRLDRRQQPSLLSRRHSASAISAIHTKPLVTPTPFSAIPGSPKDRVFNFPIPRDRSFSTPQITEENEQQQRKRASTNSSRYKTELCRPFEENGTCKYGDKCQFAHGMNELRSLSRHPKYKTEFCRTYHTIGFCPYGPRCHFVHNDEDKLNSPPTPSQMRSMSMSSMNSGPSSPILECVSSPFPGRLTPPMSPTYGEVFAFSDEMVNNPSKISSGNHTIPSQQSYPEHSPYPSPSTSEYSPLSPLLMAVTPSISVVTSTKSTTPQQQAFENSSAEENNSESSDDNTSNNSSSPPSSPGERQRRLPVFNNIV